MRSVRRSNQFQLGPGLVEHVLELCLSHHDELRSNSVHVLYTLIVNEWNLNRDFSLIQTEVIDRRRQDTRFFHSELTPKSTQSINCLARENVTT